VKAQLDGLREQIDTFVTKERQAALDEIGQRIASIEGAAQQRGIATLPIDIRSRCDEALQLVRTASLIAVIRERSAAFVAGTFPTLLGQIERLVRPEPVPSPNPEATSTSTVREAPGSGFVPSEPTAPPIEYVSITKLKVQFEGTTWPVRLMWKPTSKPTVKRCSPRLAAARGSPFNGYVETEALCSGSPPDAQGAGFCAP
jgi:hypothetical protein